MSYYFFNRQELLQKAKDGYRNGGGKEKATEYYSKNKVLRENAKNKYRNLLEEEKVAKREYGKNRYRNMTDDEKNRVKEYQNISSSEKNKIFFFV